MTFRAGLLAMLALLPLASPAAAAPGDAHPGAPRHIETGNANQDLVCDLERGTGTATPQVCNPFAMNDRAAHKVTAVPSFVAGVPADPMTSVTGGGVTGSAALPVGADTRCLDVRKMGAKLDLVSDDTTPFLNAVAAASASGYGCVFIPKSILLNEATITTGQVTIEGANYEKTWIIPYSTTGNALHLGSTASPVTGIRLTNIGFVQPVVNPTIGGQTTGQTAGAMVDFAACVDCEVDHFFSRNAWDLFTFSSISGNIRVHDGTIRTANNAIAVINGSNDQYFDHLLGDYDTPNGPSGLAGNSADACFDVTASRGSIVITNSDFGHCNIGLNIHPTNGQGVEWVNLDTAAFDTGTSAFGGIGIQIQPTGADGNGNPSYFHGLKAVNSWASGFTHGLNVNAPVPAYAEALALDNFTSQGDQQEAVVLAGQTRSVSFVNPQFYRNSAGASNTYANVRVAGAGVGNVFFLGGNMGNISGTPAASGAPSNEVPHWGIKFDAGYGSTASIIGVDLCGYGSGGAGISVNNANITSSNPLPSNITAVGSACQTQ